MGFVIRDIVHGDGDVFCMYKMLWRLIDCIVFDDFMISVYLWNALSSATFRQSTIPIPISIIVVNGIKFITILWVLF